MENILKPLPKLEAAPEMRVKVEEVLDHLPLIPKEQLAVLGVVLFISFVWVPHFLLVFLPAVAYIWGFRCVRLMDPDTKEESRELKPNPEADAQLKKELQELQAQLESETSSRKQQADLVERLREEKKEAAEEAKDTIERLEKEKEALSQRLANLNKEKDSVSPQLEKLTKEKEALAQTLDKLTKEKEALACDEAACQKEKQLLKQQIEDLQKQLHDLKKAETVMQEISPPRSARGGQYTIIVDYKTKSGKVGEPFVIGVDICDKNTKEKVNEIHNALEAVIETPSKQTLMVPAAKAEGEGHWSITFTPEEAGAYKSMVIWDKSLKTQPKQKKITIHSSDKKRDSKKFPTLK